MKFTPLEALSLMTIANETGPLPFLSLDGFKTEGEMLTALSNMPGNGACDVGVTFTKV